MVAKVTERKVINSVNLELTLEETIIIKSLLGRTVTNGTKFGEMCYKLYSILDDITIPNIFCTDRPVVINCRADEEMRKLLDK